MTEAVIELKGVTNSGQTVYDLRLNDVFVTRVHDGISGLDSLSFDYSHGSVSLTTTPISSTGAPGNSGRYRICERIPGSGCRRFPVRAGR